MRILTFGQIAVACFSKEEEMEYDCFDASSDSVLARGKVSDITNDDAIKFCPLHPQFMSYYEDAMMTLWKGKGIYAGGTESAVDAVKSLLPKGTYWYIAWNPFCL